MSGVSSVRLLQNVIETRLSTRGDGTANNPIRTLVQYWDEHGNFLAELDTFLLNERPSDSESVKGYRHGENTFDIHRLLLPGPVEIIISRNRQCDDAGERWCVRLKATNVISVHHAASYALAVDLIENEVDKWLTQRATEAQNVADVLSTALRPTDTSSDHQEGLKK